MKSGLTYIIFVIDRSGSMESIRNDMIGGFNSFIETQKKLPGTCRVFAYKFDTTYEPMFEDLDIQVVPALNRDTYVPRGGTALYDSLGKNIKEIGEKLAALKEEDRPEKVLVVTITDGEDNDHLRHEGNVRLNASQVAVMVKHQTENYKWDFAYIGANQDAWAVAKDMGYSKGTSLDYEADSAGTAMAFASLGDSVRSYRASSPGVKFAFTPAPDTAVNVTVNPAKKPDKSKKTS